MGNESFDYDRNEHAEHDWPLFKDDHPKRVEQVKKNWLLVAVMHDNKMYRVGVDAMTREDACREIVHHKMAEGEPVKRILDFDDLRGPGEEAF